MWKLSVMSLSYQRAFGAGKMDVWGYLDECRQLDVDGVDLHMRLLESDEPGWLRQVKLGCLKRGLPIACLNVSNNFAVAEADMPAQIAVAKRGIEIALALGAPQVRLFAGVPKDQDRAAAWKRCVAALMECADFGYQRGVQVCLQNHNHGALTEYGKDVLALIEQAGPHLGHVWDTGQYVGSPGASGAKDPRAQEVLYESLAQTVHLATHVRCKIYQVTSGEEEWLDYPRIFKLLSAAGYNGFCSVVYEGRTPERDELGDVRKAVPYLRKVMAEAKRAHAG
jgi:sugar phosphate isomerase/epimerase